ncbi:MAG: DUF1398 domain-containing protein [Rhodoblastus sp.]
MDARLIEIADSCLRGAESDRMSFPEIVGALMEAGFESYAIDFRSASATYYRPDGASVVLATHARAGSIADRFDRDTIVAAIRHAQSGAADYTYKGFCACIMAGGCAGYIVSFPGRRALYFGRTAETHVEHFPDT